MRPSTRRLASRVPLGHEGSELAVKSCDLCVPRLVGLCIPSWTGGSHLVGPGTASRR